MLASYKKGRDSSGHSVHPNKYNVLERPELVYRVFQTRDKHRRQTALADSVERGPAPGPSALDCAVAAKRPISRAGRTVA